MNRPRAFATAAALLAALLLARSAPAQEPGAPIAWGQGQGFSAGLKLLIDGLGVNKTPNPLSPVIDDMGAGLVLCGGYSFTPRFHVRATLGSARHGTAAPDLSVQHSVGTLEAHYRFLPDRQVCPYVFGSLGGTDVRADHGADHLKFSGGMAGVGVGTLVGLTRHVTLDLTARLDGVNWTTAEWSQDQPGGGTARFQNPIEESGGSARLELGFLWVF